MRWLLVRGEEASAEAAVQRVLRPQQNHTCFFVPTTALQATPLTQLYLWIITR